MPLPENLLTPISPENPCGEPARSAVWYDNLRTLRKPNEAAIEAFLAPQSDTNRRPRVMTREIWSPREPKKLTAALTDALQKKSKDLEVAAWLLEVLAWEEGFAGLTDGFALISSLLDTFWDQLHPLPEDGDDFYMRASQLEWVGMVESTKDSCVTLAIGFIQVTESGLSLNEYNDSRGIPPLSDDSESGREARSEAQAVGKTLPEEFDTDFKATKKAFYVQLKADATASREALATLEAKCAEKFVREGPGFTRLKERLEKAENTVEILLRKKLDVEPDPVAPPPTREKVGEVAGEPPAAPGNELALGTGAEPASKAEAYARAIAVARYLRKTEPSHPAAYLMLRGLRWGELYAAGEEIPESLLAAPPTQVRSQLKSLANGGQWGQVLDLAETAMAADYGRAWLDLQRYSVRACEALGYDHAARAIRCAVSHLLADYPKLASATLQDDTGAANPETVQWLKEHREE